MLKLVCEIARFVNKGHENKYQVGRRKLTIRAQCYELE